MQFLSDVQLGVATQSVLNQTNLSVFEVFGIKYSSLNK
jgi:hypothetical protein